MSVRPVDTDYCYKGLEEDKNYTSSEANFLLDSPMQFQKELPTKRADRFIIFLWNACHIRDLNFVIPSLYAVKPNFFYHPRCAVIRENQDVTQVTTHISYKPLTNNAK